MAISLDTTRGSGRAPRVNLPALATGSRYATMTAVEVVITVEQLLTQYAIEDADRGARLAAILAL
jgi:hypothetical protein